MNEKGRQVGRLFSYNYANEISPLQRQKHPHRLRGRHDPGVWSLVTAYRLLLGRLAFRMDRKVPGPCRFHSRLPRLSSVPWTDLLYNNQPDPNQPAVMADLCPGHPLFIRAGGLVRIKPDLAKPQTTGSGRSASLPGLPRLQPALGGSHSHQSGMDPSPFLFDLVRLYSPRLAQPGTLFNIHNFRVTVHVRRAFPHRIFRGSRAAAVHFYLGHHFRRDPGLPAANDPNFQTLVALSAGLARRCRVAGLLL